MNERNRPRGMIVAARPDPEHICIVTAALPMRHAVKGDSELPTKAQALDGAINLIRPLLGDPPALDDKDLTQLRMRLCDALNHLLNTTADVVPVDVQEPVKNPTPGVIWQMSRHYYHRLDAARPTQEEFKQAVQRIIANHTETEMAKTESKMARGANIMAASRTSKNDERIAAGQILRKTYKGKDITVQCRTNDFMYNGKEYTSLTAVAKAITGYSAISGHQFFGLWKATGDLGKRTALGDPKTATRAKRKAERAKKAAPEIKVTKVGGKAKAAPKLKGANKNPKAAKRAGKVTAGQAVATD